MKRFLLLTSIILTTSVFVLSCEKENDTPPADNSPSITGFTPSSGTVGTSVTINGKNFGDTVAKNTVTFGNATAIISDASTTKLVVTVPDAATTGKIKVSVSGEGSVSSSGTFTVTTDPTAVAIDKETLELHTLDVDHLTATVTGNGANSTVTWISDNTEVAEVDQEGNVTAVGAGTTTITAEVDNVSASCTLTVNPGIFVGGYTEKDNGDLYVSTIWKNGISQELSQISSWDTFIAIDGQDLYATHVEYGETGTLIKVYKNGQYLETLGTAPENNKAPKGIEVVNNDIYVCGNETINGSGHAKFWKNGEETILSTAPPAGAEDIFIHNGEVYVGGYQRNELDVHSATFWFNGAPTYVSDTNGPYINAITVDNLGDVYTAGKSGLASKGKIWKNTELLYDLDDGTNTSTVTSITVYNGNVYAAGLDTTNKIGKLWINGQEIFEWPSTSFSSESDITIHDSVIYIASTISDADFGKDIATVFKLDLDGTLLEEINYEDAMGDTYASSIVVK